MPLHCGLNSRGVSPHGQGIDASATFIEVFLDATRCDTKLIEERQLVYEDLIFNRVERGPHRKDTQAPVKTSDKLQNNCSDTGEDVPMHHPRMSCQEKLMFPSFRSDTDRQPQAH